MNLDEALAIVEEWNPRGIMFPKATEAFLVIRKAAREHLATLEDLGELGAKVWYCTKVDAWELEGPTRCQEDGHEACHWILQIPLPQMVAE